MNTNTPLFYNLGNNKQFLNPKMNKTDHRNIYLNSIKVNDKQIRDMGSKIRNEMSSHGICYNTATNEPQLAKRVPSKTYDKLNSDEKSSLRDISCGAFVRRKKSIWLLGCFDKPDPTIESKKINAHIFEVINFLEDKGKTCKYIFRVQGNCRELCSRPEPRIHDSTF